MAQTVSNDVSAIQPELWSNMVQVPLYKSLVALEVANLRLSDTLKFADTIHVPRFGDLSAQTYTPGTTLSATNQDWAFDNLVVSSYKHVTFYVDDARALTVNVDVARELATEAAYRLKDAIDTHVFKNITGADGFVAADDADILGGTNAKPVSAGTANIINIFAGARKILRERNVEESGDWCAVVTPKIASYIEIKAANVGFNVADATLRNGYAGDFMGFQVYISNNLPQGSMTAIAPGAGGVTATGLSATTGLSVYFGKKNTIDVALMREPALEIRKKDDMIGSNFITWTVYGSSVFTKNRSRGINMPIGAGFF
ncbi:hypothetical protein GW915_00660 [bacterium]|nr:hypothetical protein [bacterium]